MRSREQLGESAGQSLGYEKAQRKRCFAEGVNFDLNEETKSVQRNREGQVQANRALFSRSSWDGIK